MVNVLYAAIDAICFIAAHSWPVTIRQFQGRIDGLADGFFLMTIGIGILSATRRQAHIKYEPGISAAQLYTFLVRAVMKPQVFWIGYRLVALG